MKLEFHLMLKCSKQLLRQIWTKRQQQKMSALAEVHHAIWPHPRSPFLLVVENLFCLHSVRIFWVARESWKKRSFRAYSCVSQTKLHGAQFWLKLCHDCSCKERMTAHSFIKKKRRGGERKCITSRFAARADPGFVWHNRRHKKKKIFLHLLRRKLLQSIQIFVWFFFCFCYSSSSV